MDRGVIERAPNKDTPVCGMQIASAFDKPRALRVMQHAVRDKAVVALGELHLLARPFGRRLDTWRRGRSDQAARTRSSRRR